MAEREKRLDQIRKYADKLKEIASQYNHLRYMAEQPESSGAFIDLAEAAGVLTLDSLKQTGTMMEILFRASREEIE